MGDPTAALLVIGDELLSGKVEETNSRRLIRDLRGLGIAVKRVWMLPDDVPEIAFAVADSASRFDHVFTSGGIGPTHDDVTMAGVAKAFGQRLVLHPEVGRQIRDYFGERTNEFLLRMAEVPEKAELALLVDGILPVFRVENVYILPGIPSLFDRCFDAIRDRFRGTPFHVSRIYTRLDEGAIAALLARTQERFSRVAIGSYPQYPPGEYAVMVTIDSRDAAQVGEATDHLLAGLPKESIVRVER